MYLIYSKDDGRVWRAVDTYVKEDGQMRAGVDGELTLTYLDSTNVDILEVSDEVYATMDTDCLAKYTIVDGEVTEDTSYVDPTMDAYKSKLTELDGKIADMNLTFNDVAVSVSSFVSDSTYESHPYAVNINCPGVTNKYYASIAFDNPIAISGNFAPACATSEDTVTLYAKTIPDSDIVISTIFCSTSMK